tara:strand:- start:38 stop:223 length:186 start_codon:yes stop_codon:yes gene_type:complete
MSVTIFKIVAETLLIVFATLGVVFTGLTFYKGGVLMLDWAKLSEDFKRDEPKEVKVKVKEE